MYEMDGQFKGIENNDYFERIEIREALSREAQQFIRLVNNQGYSFSLSEDPFGRILDDQHSLLWAKEILQNLNKRTQVVLSALEQDISLDDTRGLFWLACRRFNFKPRTDLLEVIQDDDVLEVYDINFEYKQIFSNFRFWEMVSYPIDVILTHSFDELYQRESEQIENIFKTVNQCVRLCATQQFNIEPHIMKEKISVKKYSFLTKFKYVSPLKDRNSSDTNCIVSTISAEKINHNF